MLVLVLRLLLQLYKKKYKKTILEYDKNVTIGEVVFSIIEMFSLGTLIFEAEISISNYGFHNVFEK